MHVFTLVPGTPYNCIQDQVGVMAGHQMFHVCGCMPNSHRVVTESRGVTPPVRGTALWVAGRSYFPKEEWKGALQTVLAVTVSARPASRLDAADRLSHVHHASLCGG